VRLPKFLIFMALAAALAAIGAGCSSDSADTQNPAAVSTPRFVTDLSTLSAQPINPIMDPSAAFAATHAGGGSGLEHANEEAPGTTRHVGNDQNPGVEQLLNPKAAKFANFTGLLVDHLYVAVRKREKTDEIARLNLETDLLPVILTATLDPSGKLKEIVLEQHCGKGILDRMFIDAAKSSLWVTNPPKDAAMPDGFYRMRVELRLENYASMGDNRWFFKTYIGIALL